MMLPMDNSYASGDPLPRRPPPWRLPQNRCIASATFARPASVPMNAAAKAENFPRGQFAVVLAGYCAFINLYSPQAILPLLSHEFGASAAEVSTIITVSTLAVALTAPFTGAVADVLGRKRVIVAAMLIAGGADDHGGVGADAVGADLLALRAGPGAAADLRRHHRLYRRRMAAARSDHRRRHLHLGRQPRRLQRTFRHRHLSDLIGWRGAFVALALVTVAGALAVSVLLPRERKFVRSEGLLASGRQMLRHFRNPQLLATYAVGFGVLFNFIATFTYISFRLAAAPYNLSATALGRDLRGLSGRLGADAVIGWAVGRFGRRHFMIGGIALWGAASR